MSAAAMAWAWEQECPTAIAKLVLLRIAHFANEKTGECHPSQRLIAEACGIARETVNRAVTDLISVGLLGCQSRVDGRGGCASNLYIIPCDLESHPPCDAGSQTPVTQRSQPVNVESKKEDTLLRKEATSASPPDPVKELWDRGKEILGKKGASLIGQMISLHGRPAVLGAIVACETEPPVGNKAAYFIRCCEQRRKDAPQNYHQTPLGNLFEGAKRAADAFNARQSLGNRGDREPPALTLLDGSGARRDPSSAA